MDGGPGGFDRVELDGGSFREIVDLATGPTSGTIARDGVELTCDGLAPIADNTVVANRTIIASDLPGNAVPSEHADGRLTFASVPPVPEPLPPEEIPDEIEAILNSLTFEQLAFARATGSPTIRSRATS